MVVLKVFWSQETEMGNFKRSCLPLINDTPAGGSDHQDVSKWQEYAGIGKFIERILGNAYFPATISRITDVVKEDIEKWRHRPLHKRYSVLYLDGLYVKLRLDTVEKEVIYVVLRGMKR
ncbi:hypothetical protein GT2_13_00010, partial [Parageobacillus thermoglucosidasius NBRC 107763]